MKIGRWPIASLHMYGDSSWLSTSHWFGEKYLLALSSQFPLGSPHSRSTCFYIYAIKKFVITPKPLKIWPHTSAIVLNFFALQAIPSMFCSFFTVIRGPGQYKGPKYPSLVLSSCFFSPHRSCSRPRPAAVTLALAAGRAPLGGARARARGRHPAAERRDRSPNYCWTDARTGTKKATHG